MKKLSIIIAILVIGLMTHLTFAQSKKDKIIADYISNTRFLETNPFIEDGGKLHRWMAEQSFYSDYGIYPCECRPVLELMPLFDGYEYDDILLTQFGYAMVAFKLENLNEKAYEKISQFEPAAQLAGVESVLKTYESIVAAKKSRNAKLDALVDKRNNGKLKAIVYALALKCKDCLIDYRKGKTSKN